MKKKGLIIATIVMVLVLAVSLTTATYAWFTVSDVTTISGFDVQVVANNAVNIGLRKDTTVPYSNALTPDSYVYGDCAYTHGTPGQLGGAWTGSNGLGAEIIHNVNWGSQKKAVAQADSVDTEFEDATLITSPSFLIAANGTNASATDSIEGTLENVEAAVANNKTDNGQAVGSDYVHFVLGVQPTKVLTANQFVVLLTPADDDTTTTFGLLSAIHVAWRVNGGTWNDGEFFKNYSYDATRGTTQDNITENVKNGYATSFAENADTPAVFPTTAASAIVIDLATYALAPTQLAEVEIIIYIAGADKDCNNSALGTKAHLDMYFYTA